MTVPVRIKSDWMNAFSTFWDKVPFVPRQLQANVFVIEKSKIIKEFKMGDYIIEMNLINDGLSAMVVESDGGLTVFDLPEMKSIKTDVIIIDEIKCASIL